MLSEISYRLICVDYVHFAAVAFDGTQCLPSRPRALIAMQNPFYSNDYDNMQESASLVLKLW